GGVAYSRHVVNEGTIITDMNGDGFPDVVHNTDSLVYAYINDGNRNFTLQTWTGYALGSSPLSTANRLANATIAQSTFKTDPLIRWVAPFSGTVTINAQVDASAQDATISELYIANDPVRSVQVPGQTGGVWPLASGYRKTVNAGDKVYMRVRGLGNHPDKD